jgi:hypothetical protein
MLCKHAPIAIATVLFIGCGGGGSSKPDGGGSGGSIGIGGGGGSAAPGGATGANPTGSLVLQGNQVALLDLGPPCTNEEGATSDRWCAVFGPSVVTAGQAALFVIDVTKAAAGASITCTASDANCLKLTDSFGENDNHPALFQGDTLVYYDVLTGTPFGWRPGMTAGKMLAVVDAGSDVLACTPDTKGTAIFCLKDLPQAMQPDANLIFSDLLAGHLDSTASTPLVKVETVISANAADVNFPHFQVRFPVPGAETIAWSARATAAGPEILKMQTMGNDASRVTIASGVNSWRASPDGTRWYWLSEVDETTGMGTLQSAPFPGGAGPVMMGANVLQYDFPTKTSLIVVDMAKNLTAFADPAGAPSAKAGLDTGVIAVISMSGQGHLAYVKTTATTTSNQTFTDLFVKKSDGTGACTFTAATDAYPFDFLFTKSEGGAAWIQRATTAVQAQYTRISDCMRMNVGSSVVFTRTLNDRGVIYLDGYSSLTGTANLRLKNLTPEFALSADPATAVSGQVGSLMVTASGGTDILVYTVNGGGNEDGAYVKGYGP